jgi:hypothetical protein
MESMIFFVVFPAVMIAGVAWSYYRQAARHERMARLAQEFGGAFTRKTRLLRRDESYVLAEVGGRVLKLFPHVETRGDSHDHTMVVTTSVDVGFTLTMRPSLALLSTAARAFSSQSVTTMHPDFDDNYVLKSSDPARARVLFGSREDLRRPPLEIEFLMVDVAERTLRLTIHEQFSNEDRERAMLRYAPLLADALESSGKLLEYEGASGGLSVAEHDHVGGALSPASAPGGALSPGDE